MQKVMQTKLQYLLIATRASPPISLRHSGYFNTWTRDAADGQQRLLILNGHRTHYSLDFIRYAVQNKITLLSYPKHTTHPLQLLDVVLFAPLQQACGTAVHTHTCEARTGATKKLFFGFYSQAKRITYTRANIKAAWRAAGIQPSTPMPFYSHFSRSWNRVGAQEKAAMEGMCSVRQVLLRSSLPGRCRGIAANCAIKQMPQLTYFQKLSPVR